MWPEVMCIQPDATALFQCFLAFRPCTRSCARRISRGTAPALTSTHPRSCACRCSSTTTRLVINVSGADVAHACFQRVRLLTACCLAEILRVYAPNAPYDITEMKVVRSSPDCNVHPLTRFSRCSRSSCISWRCWPSQRTPASSSALACCMSVGSRLYSCSVRFNAASEPCLGALLHPMHGAGRQRYHCRSFQAVLRNYQVWHCE